MFFIDRESGWAFLNFEISKSVWIKNYKINKKIYFDVIHGNKCVYEEGKIRIRGAKWRYKIPLKLS